MRALLLASLLVPACVDYRFGAHEGTPELEVPGCAEVAPRSLSFESTEVDERTEELVTIDNPCEGWLEIYEIALVVDPSPFDLGEVGDVLLQGKESTGFTVIFTPAGEGLWNNKVRIETDDPYQDVIEVEVTADAR